MPVWLILRRSRALTRLLAAWAACSAVLVLAAPLGARAGAGGRALAFLVEFLTEGGRPWLSAREPPPWRTTVALPDGGRGDRWRPAGAPPYPPLVLVPGLTPDGKDDARVGWAAALLARAGCLVLVPDLPGLRAQRLRPDDAAVVAAALTRVATDEAAARVPGALVAVSVGVQPAVAGAVSPTAPPVGVVVSVGGFAEARELVRYFTTGAYRYGRHAGQAAIDPALPRRFLLVNLDLVRDATARRALETALATGRLPDQAGPEARAVVEVVENRDPRRVDRLLAALPAETRALLDALSPGRDAGRLGGRLVLVHGRDDPAIPFTESLRLSEAGPRGRTRLVLVDLLAHVEGRAAGWRQARDLARLWSVVYELLRR